MAHVDYPSYRSALVAAACLLAIEGCKPCLDGSTPDMNCKCADGATAKDCSPAGSDPMNGSSGSGSTGTAGKTGGGTKAPGTGTDPEKGRSVFNEDFEDGEIAGFERSDQAAHEGMFGARPPMLPAGGSTEFSTRCGDTEHTEVEFLFSGKAELLVDHEPYEAELSGENIGNWWSRKKIVVPQGPHTYTWKVTTENAGRPAFSLDAIICRNGELASVDTGTWGFDQGFPPLEFEGFAGDPDARWQITNTAQQAGGFGARPPILPAGGSSELSTQCGGSEHSQLEFVFSGTGELWVDDVLYEAEITGQNIGNWWSQKKIVVPAGTHAYKWKVRTENAGRPAFALDTVKCTSTESKQVSTGTWGFDQGFPPEEFTGFEGSADERWQITNTAQQDGGYGARPPILPAGGSSELSMSCGGADHSQIEFVFSGSAELLVDGASYESPITGQNIGNWWSRKTVIPASKGAHTYVWKVTTEKAGRPAFSLDTVKCM